MANISVSNFSLGGAPSSPPEPTSRKSDISQEYLDEICDLVETTGLEVKDAVLWHKYLKGKKPYDQKAIELSSKIRQNYKKKVITEASGSLNPKGCIDTRIQELQKRSGLSDHLAQKLKNEIMEEMPFGKTVVLVPAVRFLEDNADIDWNDDNLELTPAQLKAELAKDEKLLKSVFKSKDDKKQH